MRARLLPTALIAALGASCALAPTPPPALPSPALPSPALPSPVSDALVPALTVDDPAVTITPSSELHDGQAVRVQVTGFGVGGKVWLSECASAAVVTELGCGAELAAQTLLVTDDSRAGGASFVVRSRASNGVLPGPDVACADQCVIVATQGPGFGHAIAPIAFRVP